MSFQVILSKVEGVPLGILLKHEGADIIIISVATTGSIRDWNDRHPQKEVLPGDMITAVNGVEEGYFQMAEELWKVGQVTIDIKRDLTKVAHIVRTGSRSFLGEHPVIGGQRPICNPVDRLPKASAGEVNATECAICFDDYASPSDRVVVLPCKHCFHPVCAARWLCQGSNQCPLCKQAVHPTPDAASYVRCGSSRVDPPFPHREAWPEASNE
jgi:hypothetical protein